MWLEKAEKEFSRPLVLGFREEPAERGTARIRSISVESRRDSRSAESASWKEGGLDRRAGKRQSLERQEKD